MYRCDVVMRTTLFLLVPGAVVNLSVEFGPTSTLLTWSAPQEPNGVLISYEVTYRVSDGDLVTTNTTDLTTSFTIPVAADVTEISVSAYTSVGPGPAASVRVTIIATTTPSKKHELRAKYTQNTESNGNEKLHIYCIPVLIPQLMQFDCLLLW